MAAIHHIELWTADLGACAHEWDWLLGALGWTISGRSWDSGRVWQAPDGCYLVLEESSDSHGDHDRLRPGLNHLALWSHDREHLDRLREAAPDRGWHELFSEDYPHAGGPDQAALYLTNAEGFEIEIVSP